jgi:DNA polymerase-3 subunit alpha
MLLNSSSTKQASNMLFEQTVQKAVLPQLESSFIEDLYDEMELLGFPVSGSMFDLLKSRYRGDAMAADLAQHEGKMIKMLGDFVADKTVKTKNGNLMKFGTFLDEQGHFFDTVHFPPSLKAYPLYGNGVYLILGTVVMDFGCPILEVQKCARMPVQSDPRSE